MHGHSSESDPDSVFNCLSVCVFLCSDDNDTKCSELLKASLRGTSGSNVSNSWFRFTVSKAFDMSSRRM